MKIIIKKYRIMMIFKLLSTITVLLFVVFCAETQQSIIKNKSVTSEKIKTVNQECLDEHNRVRALHGVPKLELNQDLIDLAAPRVVKFAASNEWPQPDIVYRGERVGLSWAIFNYNSDINGISFWFNLFK